MKNLRKGVVALLATLVMGLIVVGGFAPEAQAATWKNMKVSKQADTPFYSKYNKTKQIKLTVKSLDGTTATKTLKVSKIESDIKKLDKAMKDGLKKDPKVTISYKTGKKVVSLTINKKSGTFKVANGSKVEVEKKFTYKKVKTGRYLLTRKGTNVKFTVKMTNTKTKKFFRLYKGNTVSTGKTLARFGTTKGKYVFAKSVLPELTVTKAQYK